MTDEQRSQTGWIGVQEWVVIFARALRMGSSGNAVDAFVTAVLSSNVVDYHQVTLPGAMGGLYYEAATGMYYVFESLRVRARINAHSWASRRPYGKARKVNNI